MEGPPEEINVPPVIGAVVGGVGALIILIIAGIILSRYAPKCRRRGGAQSASSDQLSSSPSSETKHKDVTPLTNISGAMLSKDASVASCTTVDQGDQDACSRNSGKAGSTSGQFRSKEMSSCQPKDEESSLTDVQMSLLYRDRRLASMAPGPDRNMVNNPDLVRGMSGE